MRIERCSLQIWFRGSVDVVVLHFTSNAICVMSVRNERRTSRTTCEAKKKKRQASRNNYWKDPEKHRASSRASSHACYWKDPEKKRASSHACYWKDPETKRASSHACYWKDPETKRASSRARYWKDPEMTRKGIFPGVLPYPLLGGP